MFLEEKVLKQVIGGYYIEVAAFLLWLLSLTINKTVRFKIVGEEWLSGHYDNRENFVFAFWHQATFPLFYHFRDRNIFIAPLDNTRGEILARFAKRYSYRILRTPAGNDYSVRARSFLRTLRMLKQGDDVAIAVDGPPEELMYKAKPGALLLAKMTGRPIVAIGVHVSQKLMLKKRWDNYIIPMPFSSVTIMIDKPFMVNKKADEFQLKDEAEILEKRLHRITFEAAVKRGKPA